MTRAGVTAGIRPWPASPQTWRRASCRAVIVADTITLMRAPMYELAQRGPRRAWLHGVHGGDFDLLTFDDRISVRMFVCAVAIRDAGGAP